MNKRNGKLSFAHLGLAAQLFVRVGGNNGALLILLSLDRRQIDWLPAPAKPTNHRRHLQNNRTGQELYLQREPDCCKRTAPVQHHLPSGPSFPAPIAGTVPLPRRPIGLAAGQTSAPAQVGGHLVAPGVAGKQHAGYADGTTPTEQMARRADTRAGRR